MFGLEKGLEIKESARVALVPLLGAVILAGVTLVGATMSYSRLTGLYGDLKASQEEEERLATKLDSLTAVQAAQLDPSNRAVIAFPQANPGLFMLSQLDVLAENNEVVIETKEINDNQSGDAAISQASVHIEISASSVDSIINFIKDTTTVAPLSTVQRVELTSLEGQVNGEMEVVVYWAPFPENVPAISQSIKELSSEDQSVLTQILGLTVPSFTVLNPIETEGRENPFE